MIEILNIRNSAKFPVIDFKFKNRGGTTALIHQFSVHVKTYNIDTTPVIRSFFSTSEHDDHETYRGRSLSLDLQNDGWGTADNLCVHLTSPLKELFPSRAISDSYSIASGAKVKNVVKLTISDLNNDELLRLLNKYYREDKESISIGQLGINITFQDISSIIHKKLILPDTASSSNSLYLLLSKKGFCLVTLGSANAVLMPSAIYYISIEMNQLGVCKKYPIAHKCLTGDVEYFSIMIGSDKSCQTEVRFEFLFDDNTPVTSEWFNLRIWNPVNERYHSNYINGDELISRKRLLQYQETRPMLERCGYIPAGFPFLPKEDGNDSCIISF
jgi:hypothetical protein